MTVWTMAQAKRDVEIGYLTGYQLWRAEDKSGWAVYLSGGSARGFLVDARTRERRIFKTLDSAVSAVEQIGIQVVALSAGAA